MMIIYADIRPLIITGIVLFLTNFGWNYPLPLKRKLQVPGRRMIMTKKSCQDPIGNRGTCMFKYDCIRQKGVTLSTCVDGFLFGACCFIKEDSIQLVSDNIYSKATNLVDFKESNETIYNFYQIELEVFSNKSTEYSRSVEETFSTSFSPFSSENSEDLSSESHKALFYNNEIKPNTTYLSDNENNMATVTSFFNKQLYTNDNNISSENATNISEFSTSSDQLQFKVNISEFTSTISFDNSSKENITYNIINDFNEEMENEKENSTELNGYVISKLNLTKTFQNTHEPYIPHISLSTENFFELKATEKLSKHNLSITHDDIRIQNSEPTEKKKVLPLENNLSSGPEKETTKFYNTTKISVFEILNTSYKDFITESTQNSTILNTFQTPSISTNHELISISNSPLENYSKLYEFEEQKLLDTNISLNNLNHLENTTIDYKASKSPNESTNIFNSKTINTSITLNDKKTTKGMLLPIFPWSSNSILPESFQSVLSQLIEQKIPTPGNFISNYETQATSDINLNTLVDQNLFLDTEESMKLEFKSQNISEFFDKYDKNEKNYLSEFIQASESNSPETFNFNSTPSNSSSIGLYDDKFDNINKITIPTSLFPIKELTKKEEVTENFNTDVFSKYEPNIISDKYYAMKTAQTLENFMHTSEKEKNLVYVSESLLNLFTEENDTQSKLLESNFDPYVEKKLFSVQAETFTFPNKVQYNFQETNNQIKPSESLPTLQMPNQSISEIVTSFPTAQSSLLDNSSHIVTKLLTTLNKETTTNSYPTIIQIINNHTGKNSSAFNFSNQIKHENESFINTVLTQYETTTTEGNIMKPIINNSLENNSNLYETEIFLTTSTSITPTVNAFEESQQVSSSVHSSINTDTSNSFDESLDSSQSTSFEIISSYIDFNSTNTFPSFLIDSLTSPITAIVHNRIKDTESPLTDFEEYNSTHINELSSESTDDSYNLIFTEDEHIAGFENYSDGSLYQPTTETKSHNIGESVSDESFGSQIAELSYTKTSIFTTKNTIVSEAISTPTLVTFQDITTYTDFENSTVSISSESDLNSSVVFVTTSDLETISSNTSTNAVITQNIDFQTQGNAVSNISHVYSVIHSTENTTLSTLLTSKSPNIQDDETANIDELTNLTMQTYATPVPATTTLPKVDIHRWNYKKDCGVRLMQPVGRIVGGKNTYFGKWPWQALVKEATWLGLFVKNKCGGVLITSKYVLTAAHCQPGFLASLLVVLGTHDLAETFDNKASIIRNVKRMVVHRHYNPQTFENDLALLEMEASVEFLPYVVPICLPHRNEDFTGKMAFVTGWGKLTAGGDVPSILQEVQVPIVSNGECQSMFSQAGHRKSIRSNFVCAGYTNGGQDSCEGDSGGPLMVQREDARWVLIGTVSHGIGCADPNLPGVYMRMASYRPWIDSIIYKST